MELQPMVRGCCGLNGCRVQSATREAPHRPEDWAAEQTCWHALLARSAVKAAGVACFPQGRAKECKHQRPLMLVAPAGRAVARECHLSCISKIKSTAAKILGNSRQLTS